MTLRRRAALLGGMALLLLAGCATQPPRPQVAADPALAATGDAERAAIPGWSISGRVALSNGRQGGSGRIEWSQQGERYAISLAAPVTRQSWRLQGDAAGARLDGVEGGPREGADVEDLLWTATRWRIPVPAMSAWARGVAADRDRHGGAVVAHGADNLPTTIEQAGWRIEYRDWHPAAEGRPALPRRIEAQQGEAKVRLIVDDWQLAPQAADHVFEDMLGPEALLADALSAVDQAHPRNDLAVRIAEGDLQPLAVCGFACLTPGFEPGAASPAGVAEARILDGSGDVVHGERHLQLKRQAEAYARRYNGALSQWLAAHDRKAGGAD